jgi:glyoxylase-like metal-dependent hydrolase (beta-lactamase superfamily II)
MASEHTKHWTFGDVTITRIVEVNDHIDPFTMLSVEADPDHAKHHPWLAPNFATPEGLMKISFQAFAVKTPSKMIVIDTCVGNDRIREFDIFCNMQTSYLEDLAAAGYDPEKVDVVLCTHLHFDHVGWNTRLHKFRNGRKKWVPTFPNARYLFGKTEHEHWQGVRATGAPHFEHFADSVDPIIKAGLADFIEAPHKVCDEMELFPTPGHTPGHVSVLIHAGDQDIAITGDLMHHPVQLAEPDLKVNSDSDKEQGARTRRAFCRRFENRQAFVIGSHFCEPTGGYIVRDKENWRFTWD